MQAHSSFSFALCLVFLSLFSLSSAHSYVECADWRFNNPNSYGWEDTQGTCHGYARNWPRGQYPNYAVGAFDDVWPGYEDQGQLTYGSTRLNPDTAPACHPDFQGRRNPITAAYAPSNPNYGVMVQAVSGQQLCWLWSGRNHADGGETCVETSSSVICPVYINFAATAGVDPSQADLSANNVGRVTFRNCSRNSIYTNANRPCGGCFNVPSRSAGIYTAQFRWALNANAGGTNYPETYTTCIDINITNSAVVPPTSAPATSAAATSAAATSAAATSAAATSAAASTSTTRSSTTRRSSSTSTSSSATSSSSSSSSSSTSATVTQPTQPTQSSASQTGTPASTSTSNNDGSTVGCDLSKCNSVCAGVGVQQCECHGSDVTVTCVSATSDGGAIVANLVTVVVLSVVAFMLD